MRSVVYLHGFASGPQSSKAQFFRRKFAEQGVAVEIPRLDEGEFERLTITRQLDVVHRAVERSLADGGKKEPVMLMGSSLGGYLAASYASRHPQSVERLVLMAPAFQFPNRLGERFSREEMAEWKRSGSRPFFHFGDKVTRLLGYQFVEDAARYQGEPEFGQPCLILHGTGDTVVPPEISKDFAARHPNVTLRLLPSGHELTDMADQLWEETVRFQNL
jgi:hypothetical protein